MAKGLTNSEALCFDFNFSMAGHYKQIVPQFTQEYVLVVMGDVNTDSFSEFFPFCLHLYYFSSFKAFNKDAQA